jgi:putative transposase
LRQLWKDNYCVYGAHKLSKTARRGGHDVGRDQVARLMRMAGIQGVRRGKRVRTTKPDVSAVRHPDLVKRRFTATAPNQLWVTDLTFVPTWAGVAYVCFLIDAYSRMIVGWRVASNMRTTMVLDALEMAQWSRGNTLQDLICHSDAGSQFTSIRYGERLAEIGAVPSIGTVGDSFDNALAETVNGYYKAELVYGPGPHRAVEDRRGCRTGHPQLGLLAQHRPPAQLPWRHPTHRVRCRVLRCTTDRPTPDRNPITRASGKTRAFHCPCPMIPIAGG